MILFAPKPKTYNEIWYSNKMVSENLGQVSCPEQNHFFVLPIVFAALSLKCEIKYNYKILCPAIDHQYLLHFLLPFHEN